jgi:hypothetical protein
VQDIFNNATGLGALKQQEAHHFYIAPYQRGYKWASNSSNDAVCVLMGDLFNAEETLDKEYYLQYITTKPTKIGDSTVLEVIDGQQRLTTLTILLSFLAHKIHPGQAAVSNGLLSYEIRPSVTQFFERYIYGSIEKITSETWDNFIAAFPENDEQDIYYLFHAANRIKQMIVDKYGEDNGKLQAFETYILEKVKLILNTVEKDTNCEEIFSNLNGNKIELTGAELIKGLILTTIARDHNVERRYREIAELRALIGRQWDEIAHWSNRDDIRAFFFHDQKDENAMNNLLCFLALNEGYNPSDAARTALFNHFETRIKKSNKAPKIASDYFSALRELQHILDEWFNDTTIYNKIGYLLFSKGSKDSIRNFLDILKKDKSQVRDTLEKRVLSLLNFDINKLEYYNDNDENIHNSLLAINVFCYDNSRFDFQKFNLGKWSLEHIFPQNPEGLPEILSPEDIKLIKALAGDALDSYEKVSALLVEKGIEDPEVLYNSLKGKIAAPEGSVKIDEGEKQLLYCIIKTNKLHTIGNMVLLTKPNNSSNGNGMFDRKRYNIVKLVAAGSFVPRHSYDVFSKLISPDMTPALTVWTESDIDANAKYIKEKFKRIKDGHL